VLGTGKTTVARVFAKILNRLDLLATDTLIQSSAVDLTGEYVGHTKKKVQTVLGQAKGGVLFIDEACKCIIREF
jgi:AAA+ superfamily predicted ATPase